MANTVKHNKLKNTGLIFELLSNQIINDILNNKKDNLSKRIIRKFFSEGTELYKEWKLYEALSQSQKRTEVRAYSLIESAIKTRNNTIDEKKLNQEKYDLIKEIKDNFDIDVLFSNRIKNYRVLATVYKLFKIAESNGKTKYSLLEEAAHKERIINHILRNNKKNLSEKKHKDTDDFINKFQQMSDYEKKVTFKLLIEKFNEHYNKTLNKRQITLVKRLIDSPNRNELLSHFKVEKNKAIEEANTLLNNKKITNEEYEVFESKVNSILSSKSIDNKDIVKMFMVYEFLEKANNEK